MNALTVVQKIYRTVTGDPGDELHGVPASDIARVLAGATAKRVLPHRTATIGGLHESAALCAADGAKFDTLMRDLRAKAADEARPVTADDEARVAAEASADRVAFLRRWAARLSCSLAEVDLQLERRLVALSAILRDRYQAEGEPAELVRARDAAGLLLLRRTELEQAIRELQQQLVRCGAVQPLEARRRLGELQAELEALHPRINEAMRALHLHGGPEAA